MIAGIGEKELERIRAVLARHPAVTQAVVFGSRAKGTHHASSDIDLAVSGTFDERTTERIAMELDELPLPYRFDVVHLEHLRHRGLIEHIARVGKGFYER